MSAIQMTEDQFSKLLQAVQTSGGATTVAGRPGSFSNCTARLSGRRQHDDVEEFINKIDIYKTIEKISDADAINGLPLLLTETASTWWQGVKSEVNTWEKALKLIRSAFAPSKPNYQVYMEIFGEKQDNNTNTDDFVCRKRALLAQLPNQRHNEETQLDLIYGLLNLKIREKVERSSITTFSDLLEKARHVETLVNESGNSRNIPDGNQPKGGTKKKPRCSYCNYKGHTFEVCRKRLSKQKTEENKKSKENIQIQSPNKSADNNQITCYGCGKPGFYRSNCPTCKNNTGESPAPAKVNFYSINTVMQLGRNPPIVPIKVAGIDGLAHLDTAARTSIASKELLCLLIKKGVHFSTFDANIVLADGFSKQQTCLSAIVDVAIGNRVLCIEILSLPEAGDNRTLLGIDFLEKASIILNLPQRSWSFADEPMTWYPFLQTELPKNDFSTNLVYAETTECHNKPKPKSKSPFIDYYDSIASSDENDGNLCNITKNEVPWKLIKLETPPRKSVQERSGTDYSPGMIQAIFKDAIPDTMVTPPQDPRGYHNYGLCVRHNENIELNSIHVELRENEANQ